MSALEQKISGIIEPVITDLGFALVQVKMGDGSLQIMAEDPKTKNLGVEDCKKISKGVSAIMDVEDPISGAYRLEVSSPGIDRPLMSVEDFALYDGFEAKIELKIPSETGQKRFRGFLAGIAGETITLRTDQGDVELDFSMIGKAKLVLNDELIKAAGQKFKERQDEKA